MEVQTRSSGNWQTITDARFAAVNRIAEEAIAGGAFPGCAFGVLADGTTILQDARGKFTYDKSSRSVTVGTIFDLASVSKVVATTAIAMLLYQRGLLHLDSRLGALLPEFTFGRDPDDHARNVTVRHLLAHSSGLPSYIEFFKSVHTAAELLQACEQLALEAEPGSRSNYSDPGFILLGRALERIIGESLDSFAGREVFRKIGMEATRFNPAPELRSSIPPTEDDEIVRHRRIQGEVQDENAWLLGGVAGHAGLFSNVPDILRFADAILDAHSGNAANASLFTPTTVEVFRERQGPADSSRALGWDTPSANSSSGRFFSSRSIGHLGYSGCSLWIDLDARIAVALLTNRTWPDRKSQLIRQVRPAFHNAVRMAVM